jgi:hypothetical protein
MSLELDPGEPISGRIRIAAGPPHSFRGWLELTTTLERLRTEHATVADDRWPHTPDLPLKDEAGVLESALQTDDVSARLAETTARPCP